MIYRKLLIIIVMLLVCGMSQAQKQITYWFNDTTISSTDLKLLSAYPTDSSTQSIITDVYTRLYNQGFLNISIDSIQDFNESIFLNIYLGKHFGYSDVRYNKSAVKIHSNIVKDSFVVPPQKLDKVLDSVGNQTFFQLNQDGYSWANVAMDSFNVQGDSISIYNHVYEGNQSVIDSVTIWGNLNLDDKLMYKLIDVQIGETFYPKKLQSISKLLQSYDFIEQKSSPQAIFYPGHVYIGLPVDNKNTNQADIIFGIQPNNQETGKLLITGDAKLKLKNVFAKAETFEITWQQLQALSPRLHANIQIPYILLSNFGFQASFDFYKKDSSFRNINSLFSVNYNLNPRDYFSFYFVTGNSKLINLDTTKIKYSSNQIEYLDYSQKIYGAKLFINSTDRFFNPSSGYIFNFDISAKNRTIYRNPILNNLVTQNGISFASLYDSLDIQRWQALFNIDYALFWGVSKSIVWVNQINAYYNLATSLLKNEMKQIGGNRILRGYDEQSIFAKNYSLLFSEMRYMLGSNGYLSLFVNTAYIDQFYSDGLKYNWKTGFGAGISVSTNNGIFNLNYALGQSPDGQIVMRNAKIHIGYISKF